MIRIILLITILNTNSSLEMKFIKRTDRFFKDNNFLYISIFERLKNECN